MWEDSYTPGFGESLATGLTSALGTIAGAAGVKYLGLAPEQPNNQRLVTVGGGGKSTAGSVITYVAIAAGVAVLVLVLVLVLRK